MSGGNHSLPASWIVAPLEDVVKIRDDLRKPVNAEERATRQGPYPYYGATGQVGWIDDFLMDGEYILLGEDGAPFLDPMKDKAYRVVGKSWVNNHAHVLLGRDGVLENRFLLHVLNSTDYRAFANGTTRLKLTQGAMRRIPIPVAPQNEQRRIVEQIEELFSDLDAGVAALERAKANLKRYRAAVLKAAVEGNLTAAWRAEHSNIRAAALPVATTAKSASKKRAGRLWGSGMVPPITEDERKRIGNGWCWAKVRQLGTDPDETVQVGPMSMRSQDFESTGVPVLNVGCVQWDRFEERKLDFLPGEKAAAFDRYRLRSGDVLFTRSGTVGRCAVVEGHQDGWLMTFHLLRVRPNPKTCLSSYLRMVFEGASHVRRQTRDASIGTTRAGFNTNLLADLDVPLPPIEEQTQIVAEVAEKLSQIEAAGVAIDHGLARAARLRQSILKRAFAGQLVPQDPHDEPATALLERIQRSEKGES